MINLIFFNVKIYRFAIKELMQKKEVLSIIFFLFNTVIIYAYKLNVYIIKYILFLIPSLDDLLESKSNG